MAPKVTKPAHEGYTTASQYTFNLVNGHDSVPNVTLSQWRVIVTTAPDGAGTLKTQTNWVNQPIPASYTVTNLPADNNYYYCQIKYIKPDGSTWIGHSNKFKSKP
jgi:hypothetical protein